MPLWEDDLAQGAGEGEGGGMSDRILAVIDSIGEAAIEFCSDTADDIRWWVGNRIYDIQEAPVLAAVVFLLMIVLPMVLLLVH